MSLVLKPGMVTVTQPDGTHEYMNVIVDQAADQAIADITELTSQSLTEIETKKDQVLAEIPEDYTELSNAVNEAKEDLSYKLTEPESMAVGKYFRVSAIDENGHAVLEAVDLPLASSGEYGLVKLNSEQGFTLDSSGNLRIQRATDANIASHRHETRPIVPSNLVYAVDSVLCSTAENEQLTAEQQFAARQRLGAVGGAWAKVFDFTTASETKEISFDYSEYGDDNEFFVKITIPKAETAGTISVNYNGNTLGTNRSTSVSSETVVAARLSKIGDTKFTEIFGANSLYYQNAANAWAWIYSNGNSLIKVTCAADLPIGTNVKIYRH